jgi:cysteine desulfurase / selenocysteine lyase
MKTETTTVKAYDVQKYRRDFPILSRQVNGKPLVYFDNGATTQKPKQVIDSIVNYYSSYNANIHRGVHRLSQEASAAYEEARHKVRNHLGAEHDEEIIFTKGTTDSVNLVAHAFLRNRLQTGDEIVITGMEHHSNILPWQQLCEERGAILRVIPVTASGELDQSSLQKIFSPKTKFFAFTHVSNAMGTVNPVIQLTAMAHEHNVPVFIDGAQAVPHFEVSLRDIGCDFYCFSGHKVYAPTGIGVLYVRKERLEEMQTYQVGGGTIRTVTFEKTEYVSGPLKYEAGTPNIEGAIALGAALDYVNEIGMRNIAKHEHELLVYAKQKLREIPNLRFIGDTKNQAGVISFVVGNIHPFDIGTILDQQGIAVRTGHHCTQPLMSCFGIPGTVRVSFALYNTKEEIDQLITALQKAVKMLS